MAYKEGEAVLQEDFGKDHWSLLAYIGCRVESHQAAPGVGQLDRDHMRTNETKHPLLVGPRVAMAQLTWKDSNGTRLKGFWDKDKKKHPERQIAWHDDWDCQDDLDAAGLVCTMSLINGFVCLTPKGRDYDAELRAHKQKGGMFATFVPSEKLLNTVYTSEDVLETMDRVVTEGAEAKKNKVTIKG